MNLDMRFERRLPAKTLVTAWVFTRVRKNPTVHSHVRLEIRSFAEHFPASFQRTLTGLQRLALRALCLVERAQGRELHGVGMNRQITSEVEVVHGAVACLSLREGERVGGGVSCNDQAATRSLDGLIAHLRRSSYNHPFTNEVYCMFTGGMHFQTYDYGPGRRAIELASTVHHTMVLSLFLDIKAEQEGATRSRKHWSS